MSIESIPARAEGSAEEVALRLYVTGTTPKSLQAIANTKRLCEELLPGRYTLEVVDIYQQPLLARDEQIVAAPTLVKMSPLPLCKFIGDVAKTERFLRGLSLPITQAAEKMDAKPGGI